MPALRPDQRLDHWESVLADGLAASSRRSVPEPWLAGYVHVARDIPAQPEPVQTGLIDTHHVLVFSGSGFVRETVPGRPALYEGTVHPGNVSVLHRDVTREENWTSWSEGHSFTSVMLPSLVIADAARSLDRDYDVLEFETCYGHADPLMASLLAALGAELDAGGLRGRLYAEHLLQSVAIHLVAHYTAERPVARTFTGGLPTAALRRVEAYARAHLAEEVRLADLADEAGYSEYHFCRAFKQATGRTPHAFVTGLRVEEARRLLTETAEGVASVAAAVGYASPSHFAQVFRRRVGASPSAYRRQTTG